MGSSYSLFTLAKFPELKIGEKIQPPVQSVLSEDFIEDPPQTKFEFSRRINELGTQVYLCQHEIKVNQAGRARQVEFSYFIGKHTFSSYFVEQSNLMLVKTKKAIAHHAMRSIARDPRIKIENYEIDLTSIKDLIQALKGVYITVDNSPNLNSVAYWGPSVDTDIRFEQALLEGRMYHVRIDHNFRGNYFHVGISEDCGITLLDSNLDEHNELELVFDIKREIIDKAQPKV